MASALFALECSQQSYQFQLQRYAALELQCKREVFGREREGHTSALWAEVLAAQNRENYFASKTHIYRELHQNQQKHVINRPTMRLFLFTRHPHFVGNDKLLHIKFVLQRFELFAGPVNPARIWPEDMRRLKGTTFPCSTAKKHSGIIGIH